MAGFQVVHMFCDLSVDYKWRQISHDAASDVLSFGHVLALLQGVVEPQKWLWLSLTEHGRQPTQNVGLICEAR